MNRWITLFPVVACVAACSTTPVNEQSAKPVPPERIYAPALVAGPNTQGRARVSFFRDSGLLGSGCTHDVYVNNVKAVAMRQAEFVYLALEPGQYFFRLETGAGLCPDVTTSQSTVLKEGAREVYRLLVPSDFGLRLTRVE